MSVRKVMGRGGGVERKEGGEEGREEGRSQKYQKVITGREGALDGQGHQGVGPG